ncbi:MAG: flippase-like domain-containing protein [Alcanivoracaceae bacterium]|nr:flippase-like domain-containing protein [Alcanivoracaceae bacterium]
MKKNKLITLTGYILGILSFYYIYVSIQNSDLNWARINQSINGVDYILLLFSLILYIIVMFFGALLWSGFIGHFSSKKSFHLSELIIVHAKSNIGKYLPGNFMQFVGRNLLASKIGYSHTTIILATVFEIFYSIIVGVSIILLLYLAGVGQMNIDVWLNREQSSYSMQIVFFIIIFLVLLLFKQRIVKIINKYELIYKIKTTIFKYFPLYTSAYILLGFTNIFIFMALTINPILYSDYINFLFVYLISWLLGFIVPGPPGGLGVREAIYILLLSSQYDLYIITLVAILLRFINIVGDILYFFISINFLKQKKV